MEKWNSHTITIIKRKYGILLFVMNFNLVLSEPVTTCVARRFDQGCSSGFVRVMENLESHGILEFHFPAGLESQGI